MCVLTCCLIFTVVDFLSDGAQSDRLLDDVIVVRDLQKGGQRQTGVGLQEFRADLALIRPPDNRRRLRYQCSVGTDVRSRLSGTLSGLQISHILVRAPISIKHV